MDISSMLEVEVQEVADSKENVIPSTKKINHPCQTFSKEENDFYKLTYGADIASVRFLKLHCTACDEHIGSAPAEAHNIHEHPVLRTLLCAKCREFYGDGTFEQGNDNTDMYCRWCANGGNLYCCSYCSNTFCSKCIRRNFDAAVIKKIEAEESWKCFSCDPKDLFPLRSICRALKTHIETLTRILENDKLMTPKEIEEKKHLDETKCCSRKRRRRRRTSDDDDDEDLNYEPYQDYSPNRLKKRRSRSSNTVRSIYNSSNGHVDHEYHRHKSKLHNTKDEPERELDSELDADPDPVDHDPTDLLIPCEQTMIEGDSVIFHTDDSGNSIAQPTNLENSTQPPVNISPVVTTYKNMTNVGINPVPLANLLKKTMTTLGNKQYKILHTNRRLVPVTLPSNVTLVKPTGKFIMPKNLQPRTIAIPRIIQIPASQLNSVQQQPLQQHPLPQQSLQQHSLPQQSLQQHSLPQQPIQQPLQQQPLQQQPTQHPLPQQPPQHTQQKEPSIIDLDSDDEPVVLEKNQSDNQNSADSNPKEVNVVIPEQIEEIETLHTSPADENNLENMTTRSRFFINNGSDTEPVIIDQVVSLKTQKRDQRFKQMLKLQGQEIDNTVTELKTKVLKLIQTATVSQSFQSRSLPEEDLLNSALTSTKRFHRALKKTMVELSHINDRVVRDYVHWKKKIAEPNSEAKKEKNKLKDYSSSDLPLEMVCERESESENDEDEFSPVRDEYLVEANAVPTEFATFLDHMSIFKRKPMSIKAVGDNSVLTEEKACQAYDVPWRDYEKCIGYSLVKKDDCDDKTLEEQIQPDENFGKYQEQFLFYLQHIEDFGIETDDLKGLPDPNHIPLKDLIDSTSPFIMDMLEQLSPVALSNGCTSPTRENVDNTGTFAQSSTTAATEMDISNSEHHNLEIQTVTLEDQETNKSEENINRPTSKAVQELVNMVSKLSEDLCTEDPAKRKEVEEAQIDDETLKAVQSILETNHEHQTEINDEIMDICTVSNTECVTLD